MAKLRILRSEAADFEKQLTELRRQLHGGGLVAAGQTPKDVPAIVADILAKVQQGGDEAAAQLASTLDRAELTKTNLRVTAAEIRAAHERADASFLKLMRQAIANIRQYQEHILIQAPPPLVRGGRTLGVRYTALERVAVYVPGGQALYPSTVLMTVVPAQVAGVEEIVMLSPATGGEISDLALALAHELKIDEVYRLGGAVGLAAAAFGTESIRPVNKIVGPGNAFVAEAKRQLFGRVGIDSVAGPSEVLIIADDSANPAWVAADLLAQAEHNPGSALLVTPSSRLISAVDKELEQQLTKLERADITRPSLERYSALVQCSDLTHACRIANDFATEHLQIMTRSNAECVRQVHNAGAIFVGDHTPVPLGDYYAGPSHVLPTGGTAKFFGPLSANDFIKASSVIEYDRASLAADAPCVNDFAQREGLTAHARAASIRQD